jgi:transposase
LPTTTLPSARCARLRLVGKTCRFAGGDSGREQAAAMYSLIGSAKQNGLDPGAYLRYVVTRIADHPINRISELLPECGRAWRRNDMTARGLWGG